MWIVIEGVDGAGKTTVSDGLTARIDGLTRVQEPGGTLFGQWVRAVTKGYDCPYTPPQTAYALEIYQQMAAVYPWLSHLPTVDNLDAHKELLLFSLARADTYAHVTKHADRVLQDRGMLSTYAYQGQTPQLRDEITRWRPLVWEREPDVTLLLDVSPEISLARAGERGTIDRFESRGVDYFVDVRRRYLEATEHVAVSIIDAEQTPAAVLEAAWDIIEAYV